MKNSEIFFSKKFFCDKTLKNSRGGNILEKTAELNEKTELLLNVGKILIENGATNDKTIRILNRFADFMKISEKNLSIQINQQIIFLKLFDGEKNILSFTKCNKTAVDFCIIDSITKISRQIKKNSLSLTDLKNFLRDIEEKPKIYSHWQIIFAVGLACGGFCCLFGGDFLEIICTIISAMAGKFAQIKLSQKKVNEFLTITFAAFAATTVAYFLHPTSIMPMIACALFLVPGVPIINTALNMLNKFFLNAPAEISRIFFIILSMTTGIIISVETFFEINQKHFWDFISFERPLETNIFILAAAAAICAIGFAIPLNMPKKFLYIVGILGASTVFTRYFLSFYLEVCVEYTTLFASFFVGICSILISKKLDLVSSILVVPPLLPMIPGVLTYRFLFALMELEYLPQDKILMIFPYGVDIFQITIGMVLGANLPRLIAQNFFEKK